MRAAGTLTRTRGPNHNNTCYEVQVMAEADSTVQFREVPGFPGYRVGDDGSVWSCWRGPALTDSWKRLKPGVHRKRTSARSYLYLHLWRGGKRHTRLLHRIILECFVGPRPRGAECRHLDGNPRNNALSNLCWGTHAENTSDSRRLGRFATKLTEDQAREIRRRRLAGEDRRALAAEFGTSPMNVSSIANRQSWKHL